MSKINIIKESYSHCYGLTLENQIYYVVSRKGQYDDKWKYMSTPMGNEICTRYENIANRLLSDLDNHGFDFYDTTSILYWHSILIDNFSHIDECRIRDSLFKRISKRKDWLIDIIEASSKLKDMIGSEDAIETWLSSCSHIQLFAISSVYDFCNSINIAYIFSKLLLLDNDEKQLCKSEIFDLIKQHDNSYDSECYDIMELFEIYYLMN